LTCPIVNDGTMNNVATHMWTRSWTWTPPAALT